MSKIIICQTCNKDVVVKNSSTAKFCNDYCYRQSMKGKPWGKQWKKGDKAWNSDMKADRIKHPKMGHFQKHTGEMKRFGHITGHPKGYKFTEEQIQHCSDSHKGYVMPEIQKKRIGLGVKNSIKYQTSMNSQEYLDNAREKMIKRWEEGRVSTRLFNTKPELKMKEILNELKIDFVFQKRLHNMVIDFFIPSKNLFLFCDGEYWHANPVKYKANDLIKGIPAKQIWERDRLQEKIILDEKFNFTRFWAMEILKNTDEVRDQIITLLK